MWTKRSSSQSYSMSRSTVPTTTERGMVSHRFATVALLGTCGGCGIWVRSHRISSELLVFFFFTFFQKHWLAHCTKTYSPSCLSLVQLSYRRAKHKEVTRLTTANSTAQLSLAEDEDDYIIHIQTLSEGGLGPASDPVRIHQLGESGFMFRKRNIPLFSGKKTPQWLQPTPSHRNTLMPTVVTFDMWINWDLNVSDPLVSLFVTHSCKWSHATLFRPDRDSLSSVDSPLLVAPAHPLGRPPGVYFAEMRSTINLCRRLTSSFTRWF